jgi:hypothetical protein
MSALETTLTAVRDALAKGDTVNAAKAMSSLTLTGIPTTSERDLYASCSELLRQAMKTWRTAASANGAARVAISAYREDM